MRRRNLHTDKDRTSRLKHVKCSFCGFSGVKTGRDSQKKRKDSRNTGIVMNAVATPQLFSVPGFSIGLSGLGVWGLFMGWIAST